MSFKNPIKLANLPKIKGSQYLKITATILTKKFLNGNSVPFLILLNHVYLGFDENKSEKLPFFLVGERHSCWKNYHKETTKDGASQKDFMISGTVRRNGDQFVLDIDGSKGLKKVPRRTMNFLNVMLGKINKKFNATTTGGNEGVLDADTQGAKVEELNQETKNSDVEMMRDLKNSEERTAYKEEKKAEANQLSQQIKKMTQLFNKSMKVVSKNIKKGRTSKADVKVIHEVNEAYMQFENVYKGTSAQVQKKFSPAFKKISDHKLQLYKMSLAVKQTKKSLAQNMADNYSQAKSGALADEKMIKSVNEIIKDVLKANKGVNQTELLKIISFLLKKVGIDKEKVLKYVPVVLEKKAA